MRKKDEPIQTDLSSKCEGKDLVKNGHSENGTKCYLCKSCGKSFQTDYSYNAWKPGGRAQIDEQTLNSSGVRDIGRNLKIAKGTVIRHLKKRGQKRESISIVFSGSSKSPIFRGSGLLFHPMG